MYNSFFTSPFVGTSSSYTSLKDSFPSFNALIINFLFPASTNNGSIVKFNFWGVLLISIASESLYSPISISKTYHSSFNVEISFNATFIFSPESICISPTLIELSEDTGNDLEIVSSPTLKIAFKNPLLFCSTMIEVFHFLSVMVNFFEIIFSSPSNISKSPSGYDHPYWEVIPSITNSSPSPTELAIAPSTQKFIVAIVWPTITVLDVSLG
ncbi:MAG: hypothetical protein AMQ74_01943 [Candidatus Methanofastidiosum methylothiophilum]|uniref:Uncharacterized protein n=1 Tax=Candidatus Methanofastidiosum methylothiophilum TaxID=1705564 RepID=A0A150IIB2_9EURY|nr:MAG: hypothetical protein AMQ74_01943 [Candidatus Methanofastidiosum methylthiophilus]